MRESAAVDVSVAEGSVPGAPIEALEALARDVLVAAGLCGSDAALVSENLVEAEARGVRSHGLMLLPLYVERIRQGGIRARYTVDTVHDHGAVVLLDGGGGPGQVLAHHGVAMAMERARAHGLAHVSVRNSNHCGMLATYGMCAARAGLAAQILTNAGPSVAIPRSSRGRIGNNALCMAAPAEPEPLVLDMATGVVACGKIRMAALLGDPIPPGWLEDAQGWPSADPADLDRGGAVLPVGGHKGFGLAVMIDLLTSLMAGCPGSMQVGRQREQPDRPTGVTQTFLLVDPACLGGREQFAAHVRRYAEALRHEHARNPAWPVCAPGDPEMAAAHRARTHGIVLAPPVAAMLRELTRASGVDAREVLAPGR